MMRLSEAASLLHGRHEGADVVFTGVGTDTRTLLPGELFVALRGDNYDGHRFLGQAQAAGAVAAMVDESGLQSTLRDFSLVRVGNTRHALGALASQWRARFPLTVIALTGSSGKTTVKEMLAGILREAVKRGCAAEPDNAVLATRGNLNNDIGMPLTLLRLTAEHHYAVIEMGMNHAGEIRALSQLAHPDVALVNNAGTAHIEFLGSVDAIARAKGEIFEGLAAAGTAVINADDTYAPLWRELAGERRCVDFGLEHAAQVTASYELGPFESTLFLRTPTGDAQVRIGAPGLHNVRNALAAAACAFAVDVPVDVIASGLERFSGIKGRLERKRGTADALVIDDTYNANPESMRAALAVLARSTGRKLFVLGDMGELGPAAAAAHERLGLDAREAGVDRVFALGDQARRAATGFGAGATHYERIDDLIAELRAALAPDVTVLVKGSRFMRMERVVNAIVPPDEKEAPGESFH